MDVNHPPCCQNASPLLTCHPPLHPLIAERVQQATSTLKTESDVECDIVFFWAHGHEKISTSSPQVGDGGGGTAPWCSNWVFEGDIPPVN